MAQGCAQTRRGGRCTNSKELTEVRGQQGAGEIELTSTATRAQGVGGGLTASSTSGEEGGDCPNGCKDTVSRETYNATSELNQQQGGGRETQTTVGEGDSKATIDKYRQPNSITLAR